MKTKDYLAMAALALTAVATGCTSSTEKTETGIRLSNMDTSVAPGTDFARYATGGWSDAHPLTAEYSRFGTFDYLAETNQENLKQLIEALAAKTDNAPGSAAQKIGDLYNLAMDSVKLNAEGLTPVKEQLSRITSITDKSQIVPMIAELANLGVGTYFSTYVYADPKNSSTNIFQISQGGLNLREKEYYLSTDSVMENIRAQYRVYITRLFSLAGYSEEEAQKKMEAVMDIETAIAGKSYSAVERRDPEANYHKLKYSELKRKYAGINWDAYLAGFGVSGVDELNLEQPEPIKEVERIINTFPLEKNVAYLEYNLLDAAAPKLSDDFVAVNFDFYGKVLSGKQVNKPRWKRAVGAANTMLGELVGQMYVEKYFPAAAKERMLQLVKNLQVSLGERIDCQEWMSDETKARAHEKLGTFTVKIGYPDKWKDYSNLDIRTDSYWANACRAAKWEMDDMYSRIGKPVDRSEWFMTPQTVNAYYNPSTNEICFPAAILQYPFFDMEADDACNYGAIGVVIGHEMTHGFDDQGRQFDKDGNLSDWWAEGDADRFKERAQVMIDFFDGVEVLPGLHGNGALTLGENIADHGGLKIAYNALLNATKDAPLDEVGGFTPEQRFFLSYALLWAGNIRDEQARSQTATDPHSLPYWRINGALPQVQAWYDAFGITESDPMYIAPEKRVNIW